MRNDFYAEIAQIYDQMIPWSRRLEREGTIFERLWQQWGVRSLLDAACGSGGHLELFARQSPEKVVGTDASREMLALAEKRLAPLPAPRRPALLQAAWAELPDKLSERFDCVLCLGNSLPHLNDSGALHQSLDGMFSVLAGGGRLLIQFKNFARMRRRGERFLPLTRHKDATTGRETLFVRQYEWHPHSVDFTILILTESARGDWTMRHATTRLATLEGPDIAEALAERGAEVTLWGSLDGVDYDRLRSEDVVVVARRQ